MPTVTLRAGILAVVCSATASAALAQTSGPDFDAPATELQAAESPFAEAATDVGAEPQAVAPPGDYQELLNRLREAEGRIADLETPQTEAAPQGQGSAAGEAGRARVTGDGGSNDDAEDDQPDNDSAADNREATDGAGDGAAGSGDSRQPDNDSAAENRDTEVDESGGDDVTDRLKALQKGWDELQEAEQALKDAAKEKPTFKIGGRIHLDHWSFLDDSEGIEYFEHPDEDDQQYGTDPEDRFVFRRIRLEAEGDIPDLMFWRLQVEFGEPENPGIRDVYLGWELPANQRLIVGNQKRPIGLDSIHSSRYAVFMERPLSNDAFNEDFRRLGVQMWGYSDDLTYNWRYGVFNLENIAQTGQYVGDSLQLGGYGRLAATPWYDEASDGRGYLHLGVSGSLARPDGDATDADSNRNEARFRARPSARTDERWIDTGRIRGAEWFEQAGLESALNIGAWYFEAEYLTTAVQRDETTRGTGPDVFFHGGYVQAAYFLTGEYMPWDRETGQLARIRPLENFFLVERCTGGTGGGWGAWQVKARYDRLDLTDSDIRGGVENNVTFGLNWWWNPFARMQFDVTRGEIEQHRPVGGFDGGDFWHAGTRFMVDF